MNQINELSALINQTFNWNKARIDCLVGMLIALLSTRSINLTELAIAFQAQLSRIRVIGVFNVLLVVIDLILIMFRYLS
ncbi:MAG: hypothetical protein IPL59_05515 [Candidatus Competibacteraceae bacterium]|nr:hypothetical protein [Candidatus Competibacteraceae bacterium]